MFVDEFWRNTFPIFDDNSFIYTFLDLATILCMIRIFLNLPAALLFHSSRKL